MECLSGMQHYIPLIIAFIEVVMTRWRTNIPKHTVDTGGNCPIEQVCGYTLLYQRDQLDAMICDALRKKITSFLPSV